MRPSWPPTMRRPSSGFATPASGWRTRASSGGPTAPSRSRRVVTGWSSCRRLRRRKTELLAPLALLAPLTLRLGGLFRCVPVLRRGLLGDLAAAALDRLTAPLFGRRSKVVAPAGPRNRDPLVPGGRQRSGPPASQHQPDRGEPEHETEDPDRNQQQRDA